MAEPFVRMEQDQAEAMRKTQSELVDVCREAGQAWMDRMKLEADFWSGLTSKLSAVKSPPEALEIYQKSIAQRMQMATEDARRMAEQYQNMLSKFHSFGAR